MAGTEKQKRFSFTKDERLKSRKLIEELFSNKTFVQNPTLRIYFKQVELNCAFPAQFAFSVSKKIFPNAADRNRVKRLMRESIRLQKAGFYDILNEHNQQFIFLLSYHSKEINTYHLIDNAIKQLLDKLANEWSKA